MKKDDLITLIESTISNINSINTFLKSIDEEKEKLATTTNEIYSDEDGLLNKIRNFETEASEKLNLILKYYHRIYEGDEENESISNEIDSLLKYYQESKEKINTFRIGIFGSTRTDENGETQKTIGLKKKIETFYAIQEKKYNDFYKKIESELEGGATTVNLAKSFADKVKEYKKSTNLWSSLLIVLLVVMSIYYGILTWNIAYIKTWEEAFKNILFRVPFLAFIVWLGIVLGNRRAESKKLEESYKHKEVMARSFVGYKNMIKEIEEDEDDKNLLKEHMKNMLKAISEDSGKFLSSKGEEYPLTSILQKRKNDNLIKNN